jgi:hypothetical protein
MILSTKSKNVPSVQRITTQRVSQWRRRLPARVESPVFGHSDAHVVLQIADLVVSAMLFPMPARVSACVYWTTHTPARST